MQAPSRIAFSEHAAERATRYGIAFGDIADAVLDGHSSRRKNPGSADWLLRRQRLTIIYNWPDNGDPTTARIVTLWAEE